ncbi:hypothetical protein M231_01359 [Tremella mesenterica]|uniref:Uncharacterized protein n=1 Tax=Tremella mesenterica TaxID=5217 RepID=A0A4Q1BTP1_TREME|nr:hypothetical protein M231_01359 [Tremella mesenterica]
MPNECVPDGELPWEVTSGPCSSGDPASTRLRLMHPVVSPALLSKYAQDCAVEVQSRINSIPPGKSTVDTERAELLTSLVREGQSLHFTHDDGLWTLKSTCTKENKPLTVTDQEMRFLMDCIQGRQYSDVNTPSQTIPRTGISIVSQWKLLLPQTNKHSLPSAVCEEMTIIETIGPETSLDRLQSKISKLIPSVRNDSGINSGDDSSDLAPLLGQESPSDPPDAPIESPTETQNTKGASCADNSLGRKLKVMLRTAGNTTIGTMGKVLRGSSLGPPTTSSLAGRRVGHGDISGPGSDAKPWPAFTVMPGMKSEETSGPNLPGEAEGASILI